MIIIKEPHNHKEASGTIINIEKSHIMKRRIRKCFHPDVSDSDVSDQERFAQGYSAPWHFGPRRLTPWHFGPGRSPPDILDLDVSPPDSLDQEVSPMTFWTRTFAHRTFSPRTFWTWTFRDRSFLPDIFGPGRFVPCLFGPGRFSSWYFLPSSELSPLSICVYILWGKASLISITRNIAGWILRSLSAQLIKIGC